MILDEPTRGLDVEERINFRNLMSKLSFSKIILISTHINSDIEGIAKEILKIENGQITVRGVGKNEIRS